MWDEERNPAVLCFQQRSEKLECQGSGKLEGPEPSEVLVAQRKRKKWREKPGENHEMTPLVLPALVVTVLRLQDPIRVSKRAQASGDGAA